MFLGMVLEFKLNRWVSRAGAPRRASAARAARAPAGYPSATGSPASQALPQGIGSRTAASSRVAFFPK